MSGGKHLVNSENKIDWNKQLSNDFVIIDNGEKFVNKKSISEIVLVKRRSQLVELIGEGKPIKLSDFEHLKSPPPPAFEDFQFNPLPRDNANNTND